MQTIHLQVEDNKLEAVLKMLSNFKEDLVKSLKVVPQVSDEKLDEQTQKYLKSEQFLKDKAYFQKCLEDIESGESELISHEDYIIEMGKFTENLKLKYANN